MALPTNTRSTAGIASAGGTGIRNSVQITGSAPTNTSWKIYNLAGTGTDPNSVGIDPSLNNQTGPTSGSGSYRFGITGKPESNGLEKALGAIGSAFAIVEVGKSLFAAGAGVIQGLKDFGKAAGAIGDSLKQVGSNFLNSEFRSVGEDTSDIEASDYDGYTSAKAASTYDWRVRISVGSMKDVFREATANYLNPLVSTGNGVIFPYTPQITVLHKANYSSQQPVHSNFPFHAYKNSEVDDIQINGTFTVQNDDEGRYWLAAVRFFQTLAKSFYGQSIPNGFPPPVAQLYGYGNYMFGDGGSRGINIVVKSFSLELSRNVQYKRIFYNADNAWVPLESNIALTVTPVYNRSSLRRFNLNDYANGGQRGVL